MKKNQVDKKVPFPPDTIVSLITVAQNDADIIADRLHKINNYLESLHVNYEILVVDNNSNDKTIDVIKSTHENIPFIRTLILSKSYDLGIALTAGLDNCIGDYAVLFNVYSDPPEMLPTLIKEITHTNDIVIGEPTKDLVTYSILSKLFLRLLKNLSSHEFSYQTHTLIALNRKAINAVIRTRRKSRNFSYINHIIGLKKYIVSYEPLTEFQYKIKSISFFRLFFIVADIIISNSYKPIRVFSFLGIFASLAFLLYVFLISIIYFFVNRSIAPQGWISLATVMGCMFFFLFSLLTFIAEYIIRTLHETRNEPLYFISDEIDKSVILTKQDMLNIV